MKHHAHEHVESSCIMVSTGEVIQTIERFFLYRYLADCKGFLHESEIGLVTEM